ncbi:MAG: DNA polymerase IV [Mariprofundaceae bacterium]|nr:DNA polymerase IV [Mariprofundaceae bacterium]
MDRTIMHVDMDAFFAAVEVRERPELAGQPVIVGGRTDGRGVVAAASYEARRFGIHSAMPTAQAMRLCPDAVLLRPHPELYARTAREIRAIFARVTPLIEPLSLDEAFLDISDSLRLFGSAEQAGRHIRDVIRNELKLSASVGIAPNKFVAKIASDIDKPDGFVVVHADDVLPFLAPLRVSHLWGVGHVTEKKLSAMGIRTIADLRRCPSDDLRASLGTADERLWQLAHGVDDRPVVPDHEARYISHETTFARDIADTNLLRACLLQLTEQVAHRLRRQKKEARHIHLKVRFSDYATITRRRTLAHPTDVTTEIWQVVRQLFNRHVPTGTPVRLLGMGVSGLALHALQAELFHGEKHKRLRHADAAVDAINERFGKYAVHRGGLPGPG